MKTVLHLNASSGGGAFVVAQRLSKALNESGKIRSNHLVYTGLPGEYSLWSQSYFRRKYAFGLHALEKLDFLRFERDPSVRFAFSHGKTGIDIAINPLVKEADILHLHWINKGFISLRGLRHLLDMGKQVVWTCHDQWPFTGGCYYSGNCDHFLSHCGHCPMLKNPSEKDLSHRIFEKKTGILNNRENLKFITPSDWLRNIGLNSDTSRGIEIRTIPNALDTEIFGLSGRRNAGWVRNFGNKFTIMFAAVNIADTRKGFEDFRTFCRLLVEKGLTDFRVVYVGENKGQFEDDPLYEQQFTGYIRSETVMAEWYRKADLYVSTSNDDNLPTTIMESLSCGTPVAAFAVGGIPEMIDDESTGLLAPVHHSAELADKVISMFEGRFGSPEEIAIRCRNFVLQNYEKSLIAGKHLDLYSKLKFG